VHNTNAEPVHRLLKQVVVFAILMVATLLVAMPLLLQEGFCVQIILKVAASKQDAPKMLPRGVHFVQITLEDAKYLNVLLGLDNRDQRQMEG